MNTDIKVFTSPVGADVRVVVLDNEPWFVAKDICDCLGTATRDVRKILDDDEVSYLPSNVDTIHIGSTGGSEGNDGGKDLLLISEPGLYSLVLKSRKPEAKAFKRWVTHDVLPTIRKTGMYGGPKTLQESLRAYADLLDMNERNQRLALEAQAKVAELTDNILVTEAQRDKAIREKAQINSSRVGTCMRKVRTANEAKRKVEVENDELKIKLGEATSWKTVTAMEQELRVFFKLDNQARRHIGKTLASVSNQLGLQIKKAADARYGQVNAYHEQAWDAFIKGLTKPTNANFMKQWRRG